MNLQVLNKKAFIFGRSEYSRVCKKLNKTATATKSNIESVEGQR